jgi:hypothetical protein
LTGEGRAFDISQVLVSEEVRDIRREGWSGVLALTQGEVAKGLYFIDGSIVFAASTVEEDRLGANLFRNGRITEPQFRAAMTAAQTPGVRLGQALVEAGVLTPAELEAAVIAQVERIVLSVFRWSSGKLQRRGMERPLPADLVLQLSTPRLLLLGAREILGATRLEPVLGGDERRLRPVATVPFDYEQLPPSPGERAVLALATGGETTLGAALELPLPRPQLLRGVYALVAGELMELLEPAAPVAAAFGEPEPEEEANLLSELEPPAAEPPPEFELPAAGPPPEFELDLPEAPGPDDTIRGRRASQWDDPAAPPGQSTRPTAVVDPDLLTPSPPPESETQEAEQDLDREDPALSFAESLPTTEVPDDPEEGERRALALLEKGHREPAVMMLEHLVERHPRAHAVRRLLAMTMATGGSFDRSVERHFLADLEAEPGDVEARYRLARYYRRAGMTARAVLQLRLVLSADPGHAAAWRDLGELDADAGRR